jgi:dephospho-CoA kinase
VPLILGVTGSIATGKSSLCRYLVERHGAVHADGDRVVHRMYDPGRPGFDRIVAEFGEGVVGADGYIDRRVLGGMVFGRPERMKALTTAIGDIKGEMKGIIDEWRATLPHDAIAVIEIVLLIEERYARWCDQTWLVGVDDAIAVPRLMERNGLTEAEARQRLASAVPWENRAPAADRVFMNAGTPEDLEREVDLAIEEMMARHRAGTLGESQYVRWQRAVDEAQAATDA